MSDRAVVAAKMVIDGQLSPRARWALIAHVKQGKELPSMVVHELERHKLYKDGKITDVAEAAAYLS